MDVCVQYKNNPANALRDIVQKLNLSSAINKVNNRIKIKDKKLGQRSLPRKAHLHPLRDVCVQYENNPANALRDIIRKLNLTSAIN